MSGARPFNEIENGRIYEIDDMMVLIPKRVIDKILHWNENEALRKDVAYDKKICQSLLVCLTSKDDLANSRITEDVKEFIKGRKNFSNIVKYSLCKSQSTFLKISSTGILQIRCKSDRKRIGSIQNFIDELCGHKGHIAATD